MVDSIGLFMCLSYLRFIIVLGAKPSIVESNRSVFGVINAYLVMVSGTKDGGGQTQEP